MPYVMQVFAFPSLIWIAGRQWTTKRYVWREKNEKFQIKNKSIKCINQNHFCSIFIRFYAAIHTACNSGKYQSLSRSQTHFRYRRFFKRRKHYRNSKLNKTRKKICHRQGSRDGHRPPLFGVRLRPLFLKFCPSSARFRPWGEGVQENHLSAVHRRAETAWIPGRPSPFRDPWPQLLKLQQVEIKIMSSLWANKNQWTKKENVINQIFSLSMANSADSEVVLTYWNILWQLGAFGVLKKPFKNYQGEHKTTYLYLFK